MQRAGLGVEKQRSAWQRHMKAALCGGIALFSFAKGGARYSVAKAEMRNAQSGNGKGKRC